jgi:hypothetical protein
MMFLNNKNKSSNKTGIILLESWTRGLVKKTLGCVLITAEYDIEITGNCLSFANNLINYN